MLPQSKLKNKLPKEQLKILFSGLEMEKKLLNKMKEELLEKLKENRPLAVKAGFDPSRPDLHLGHSILIHKLRQFQELGHKVVFVVGDWTACIGDPSGQNKTRPLLSFSEVKENAETYIKQATRENFKVKKILSEENELLLSFFRRLDFKTTEWVYNSKWLNELSLKDFILKYSSKLTVARQMERNDFSQRYSKGKPIGLHEFLYPVLQAYDSVELKADVELGGTDQLFNLLLGRELQELNEQSPQVVLTLPLLEGIDSSNLPVKIAPHYDPNQPQKNWNIIGARKMSKSLNNAICFNDSAKDIYGKVMSISDHLLIRWWSIFTEGKVNLENIFKKENINPKIKKEELAWLLVCSFYGEDQAFAIQKEFNRVFSKGGLPDQILEAQDLLEGHDSKKGREIGVCQLIKEIGLSSSNSEAKRGILAGAVKEGEEKITDPNAKKTLKIGDEFLLRFGKRKFKRVNLKWEEIHELKAYFTYRKIKEGGDKNKLCKQLSEDEDFTREKISLSSIKMKLQNNEFLDTGKGLKSCSKKNQKIFNRYQDHSIKKIKDAIKKLQDRKDQSK